MNPNETQPINEVAFDAASLGTTSDAEKPRWMEIQSNRDGSGTGIQFELVGRDSKAYRALNRKFQNKRFEKMAQTRKLKLTAEENEAENLQLLAECVTNFRSRKMKRVEGVLVPVTPEDFFPTINIRGKQYEYNKENLKLIFKTVPEMREQVEDYLMDRVNFSEESQNDSSI